VERDLDPGLAPSSRTAGHHPRVSEPVRRQLRRGEEGHWATVRFRGDDAQLGDQIEIRIRDNGTSIARKAATASSPSSTKPTGEGATRSFVSYDIVTQQHGGTISVTQLARYQYGAFAAACNGRA
jgi:hypothetical protein